MHDLPTHNRSAALPELDFHFGNFDHFPAMVWVIDREGRYVYQNHAAAEFSGRTLEEVSAEWLELVHPDDRVHCAEVIRTAFTAEQPFVVEFRFRCHNGEYRGIAAHGSPMHDRAGKFVGVIGFAYDITERHQKDLALRETEEQIRLLDVATHEMVWNWDARTDEVLQSSSFVEVLGEWPREYEQVLPVWRDRVHPEDIARIEAAFQEAIAKGEESVSYEYRLRDRSGAYISVDDRVTLMRDPAGKVVRVLGAMRDISKRKRAEEAQARLVHILEATNDFVGMATPEGFPFYISTAGRRMIGWDAEEPLHEHLSALYPAWAAEILTHEGIPTAIAEGSWKGETALLHREGREIPVAQVILAHQGADRSVKFLSTVMRDLSVRKREEVARIEWANRYDAAIRASGQLLFDWDAATNDITYAGDAEQLLGYSMHEMRGGRARFRELIHADDREAFDKEIERVTVMRDPFRHEFRLRRKDGVNLVIDAKGYFFLNRQGRYGRMVGFLADVSAQKAAQAELARAHDSLEARVEERTAELARASSVIQDRAREQAAVAYLGQQALTKIELSDLFNEATALVRTILKVEACAMCELVSTGQELVVRGSAGLPEKASRMSVEMNSQLGETLLNGKPVIVEELAREPRFAHDPLRALGAVGSVSVVVGGGKEPFGVLLAYSHSRRSFNLDEVHFLQSVANILTAAIDHQRGEESVRLAREQAETANRAKSEFLSRMSHELRTPLNAILGFTQLLEIDAPTESQSESIQHITRAGGHLLLLINEVLDIARIESGRLALSPEPIALDLFLSEVIDLIRPLAARYDIEPSLGESCDGCVLADRQRLQQVLLNLLSNAVKYNRPGGQVTVTCAATDDGRVRINVADTGRGISAEKMPRLFVPFDRLGAEATDIEGTGIGLALSLGIVLALHGELLAESVANRGSTFSVILPAAQAESLPERAQTASTLPAPLPLAGNSTPRTLLYIEDQDLNLRLVERILQPLAEYRLLTAMQGGMGLDLAREHQPDLILLDLNLPDMSGDEVLRRLKEDAAVRDIPVIMVSADAMGERIQQLLGLGATGYLTKPYRVTEFLRVIRAALSPTE